MGKKKEKKEWAELIWLVASAVCVAFLLSPTPPPPPPLPPSHLVFFVLWLYILGLVMMSPSWRYYEYFKIVKRFQFWLTCRKENLSFVYRAMTNSIDRKLDLPV